MATFVPRVVVAGPQGWRFTNNCTCTPEDVRTTGGRRTIFFEGWRSNVIQTAINKFPVGLMFMPSWHCCRKQVALHGATINCERHWHSKSSLRYFPFQGYTVHDYHFPLGLMTSPSSSPADRRVHEAIELLTEMKAKSIIGYGSDKRMRLISIWKQKRGISIHIFQNNPTNNIK